MAEKGFRLIKCAGEGCPLTLKIPVVLCDYGKTVIVCCDDKERGCGTQNRVTIPHPPAEKQRPMEKLDPAEFLEKLSPELRSAFELIFGKKPK